MDDLVGPKSETSLTARWFACKYGFAVAAGRGRLGFGVVVAQDSNGQWVTKRGLDDGACDFTAPGSYCGEYAAPALAISQSHLLNLVYAAHLTVGGNEAINGPQPKSHRTGFAQGRYTPLSDIRPKQLQISSDGTFFVKNVHWTRWSSQRATGYGTGAVNDCTPDCAGGKFHRGAVAVRLMFPTRCEHWDFDRVVIHWKHAPPLGLPRTTNAAPFILGCQ
jgi:hypothetical protein